MKNYIPVFQSRNLALTPIELDSDSAAASEWSSDARVAAWLRDGQPARPLSAFEVKKKFEEWLKASVEQHRSFFYALRTRDDNRLIGFLRIGFVMWVHSAGNFDLILAGAQDRTVLGAEALELAMRYAFDELNLFRVSTHIAEHDWQTMQMYEQARFFLEVRQRQAVYHAGRYWDRLHFGMLRPEWLAYQAVAEVMA